jgi:hypothetical protein
VLSCCRFLWTPRLRPRAGVSEQWHLERASRWDVCLYRGLFWQVRSNSLSLGFKQPPNKTQPARVSMTETPFATDTVQCTTRTTTKELNATVTPVCASHNPKEKKCVFLYPFLDDSDRIRWPQVSNMCRRPLQLPFVHKVRC